MRNRHDETGNDASRRSPDMPPSMACHRQQKYPRLYKIKPILWVEVDAKTIMASGVTNRRVLPQCQGRNLLVGINAGRYTDSLVVGKTLVGQGARGMVNGQWSMVDGQWSMVKGEWLMGDEGWDAGCQKPADQLRSTSGVCSSAARRELVRPAPRLRPGSMRRSTRGPRSRG